MKKMDIWEILWLIQTLMAIDNLKNPALESDLILVPLFQIDWYPPSVWTGKGQNYFFQSRNIYSLWPVINGIYFNLLIVLFLIISNAVDISTVSIFTLFDFEIGNPQRKRTIFMCFAQQNCVKTNQVIFLLLS